MKKLLFPVLLGLSAWLIAACSGSKRDAIGRTEVVIETSRGNITLRLYDDTPQHRDNFIRLVREGVYDGLLWNRIVPEGTIQTGDLTLKAHGQKLTADTSKYNYTVPPEIVYPRHFHKAGALAMAREADDVNPGRESSSTQFYIVSGKVYDRGSLAELNQFMRDSDTTRTRPPLTEQQKQTYTTRGGCPHLDGDYTVFGEVVDGLPVVQYINRLRTDEHERPLKEVVIKRIRIKE